MNRSHSVRAFALGFAAETHRSCFHDQVRRHPDQTILSPGYDIGFVPVGKAVGSIGKNGTSNFTNASEWAWHVESRAWYAEVTGYTATTVHVHFGPLLACSNFTSAGRVSTKYKATLSRP